MMDSSSAKVVPSESRCVGGPRSIRRQLHHVRMLPVPDDLGTATCETTASTATSGTSMTITQSLNKPHRPYQSRKPTHKQTTNKHTHVLVRVQSHRPMVRVCSRMHRPDTEVRQCTPNPNAPSPDRRVMQWQTSSWRSVSSRETDPGLPAWPTSCQPPCSPCVACNMQRLWSPCQ